mgnify:CR=1 FL=1
MRHLLPLVLCMGCVGPVEPTPDPNLFVQTKTVIGKQLEPNITLLIDRSSGPRLDEIRPAVGHLVRTLGAQYRFGLATLPSDAACGAGTMLLPVGAPADAIEVALGSLPAQGDVPLAATLETLTSNDAQREDFVVVLTGSDDTCGGNPVAAVRALRQRGLRTVVVPLGSSSPQLDAMAIAGGFPRLCPNRTAQECGGEPCDAATGTCASPVWTAADRDGLVRAFDVLFATLPPASSCRYRLEVLPSRPDQLSVLVDGTRLDPGPDTWRFDGSVVELLGVVCRRLEESTVLTPARVELRVNLSP